jgi:hypothetical protein
MRREFAVNAETLTVWLGALPLAQRAKFLVGVAFQLTIYAREYAVDPESSGDGRLWLKRLRGHNELQRKILSQAGHYLDGEQVKVFSVDAFSRIIFEIAESSGISNALARSVEYLSKRANGIR